jgi:hypothetical protein
MIFTSLMRRKGIILALMAITANLAGNCPPVILPPVLDFVEVELINDAFDPVEPNLFVDGVEFIIDPPLLPGEILPPEDLPPLDFPCGVGTTIETFATLLAPFGDIFSVNDPFLEEGFEFFCGDLISFVFVDDGVDFFTEVFVNGDLIITLD